MTDLEKRLKNLEDMFSISRKNQPKKIGQMNANDERIDKLEERFDKIEESNIKMNESIVKIQQQLEISNIPEVSLPRALDFSYKFQDTTLQSSTKIKTIVNESIRHVIQNASLETQNVNNLSTDF
jgi:hypothetical protein